MRTNEECIVCSMGLRDYGEVWELQKRLHGLRTREEIPDVLLVLEHTPTFTVGKSGSTNNVLISPEKLARMGISLFFIERGGGCYLSWSRAGRPLSDPGPEKKGARTCIGS